MFTFDIWGFPVTFGDDGDAVVFGRSPEIIDTCDDEDTAVALCHEYSVCPGFEHWRFWIVMR